jgi:hypothetical protein
MLFHLTYDAASKILSYVGSGQQGFVTEPILAFLFVYTPTVSSISICVCDSSPQWFIVIFIHLSADGPDHCSSEDKHVASSNPEDSPAQMREKALKMNE